MRKEISNWLEQSINDFEKAKILNNGKSYDGCAFFCQQACEKALKALILFKSKDKNVEGHSLVHLGTKANIPKNLMPMLRDLSPQYFLSRYPDVTEDVPFKLYDISSSTKFLHTTELVLKWIKTQLR